MIEIKTMRAACLAACLAAGLAAQAKKPDSSAFLRIYPPRISLQGARDLQRIVVILTGASGITEDVTAKAKLSLARAGLARLSPDAMLEPLADGKTELRAGYAGHTARAELLVKDARRRAPLSFRNDVIPILTHAGCNAGSCHGSASGKNGFRLSLFGYDPDHDLIALTRELRGRRLDVAHPRASLMLQKPTRQVKHKGGKKLTENGPDYAAIEEWIKNGARPDPKTTPKLDGIEILPAEALLAGPGRKLQLLVAAHYADGTDRDVTAHAIVSSSNETAAKVTAKGIVTSAEPGETSVMARYGDFAVVSQILVLRDDRPFSWPKDIEARNYIDEAIHRKLRRLRLVPAGVCNDATFVRRVFLDTIGLLPTSAETRAFLADRHTDKRRRLVETLLRRPEFAEVQAMQWAELFQIEPRKLQTKGMYGYRSWLAEAFRRGETLDRIVFELLTAEGGSFENPPVNIYLTERRPQQIAENVSQIFMGVRVQCAQCHNHPFERWTMDDYYGFAAFFSQVGRKRAEDPRETIVFNRGRGEVNNLRSGRPDAPKFLGGARPEIKRGQDRRRVLAEWLTSKKNPYFAKNIANRVFARFFGRGIVDPPDDVRVSNPPSHPELFEMLGKKLIEYDFDMRPLIRDICTSRSYQLAASPDPLAAKHFAGAAIRRLSAEQLLDAIGQVTGVPSKYRGLPLGARATEIAYANPGNRFLDIFGRPRRISACVCERHTEPTLAQALHLINGETIRSKLASPRGRLRRLLAAKTPPAEITSELWLRAYGRAPRRDERELVRATLQHAKDKAAAFEDVAWAVLNSHEFLFNH